MPTLHDDKMLLARLLTWSFEDFAAATERTRLALAALGDATAKARRAIEERKRREGRR